MELSTIITVLTLAALAGGAGGLFLGSIAIILAGFRALIAFLRWDW